MSKMPIRWGILGTSYISEVMASAIINSQTSRLTAVASRSINTASAFANQFSIQKYYDDYQLLLDDDEIDAIYIGLPNHLHAEWSIRCAQAKKHILCEKPFAISEEEVRRVIAAVDQSEVFCMEALMYRCHPFTKKLEEIIASNIIGDVKLYNATYTANIADIANPTAGGSIRNLGCYPISLVRLLAKAEPIEISGAGRINQQNNTDNQASAILKFADHSMAVVSTADDIDMFWQFDIYGTKGCLKVITNPWLPTCDENKVILYINNEKQPIEINVQADKPLYTYQIDVVNQQIMRKDNKSNNEFNGISLLDSLGNTIVLETWLQKVKAMNPEINIRMYQAY